MDDDDWASDGQEESGLGDLSAIPEVKVPLNRAEPEEASKKKAVPPQNAWTKPNQSGDVRAPQQPVRQAQPPPRSLPRRDIPFSNPGARTPERADRNSAAQDARNNIRSSSSTSFGRPLVLYVTNLPFSTNELEIAAFFAEQGVPNAEVRLTRHNDSGNIKAAFVTVRSDLRNEGLAVDGKNFGSRTMHVKVEGTDGNRRGNRDRERPDRERSGYTAAQSYGGAFGGRDRRSAEDSNQGSAWGPSTPGNRMQSSFEPAADRRSGDYSGRVRDAPLANDPTIPTGPTPTGRKKLQLKPRTKPLPVLDVDPRAIDPPSKPSSAAPASTAQRSDTNNGSGGVRPFARGSQRAKKAPNPQDSTTSRQDASTIKDKDGAKPETADTSEGWESAKDTAAPRNLGPGQTSSKKDDGSNRPMFGNAFAALGGDADA